METMQDKTRLEMDRGFAAGPPPASPVNPYFSYAALVILPIAIFFLILSYGTRLPAATGMAAPAAGAATAGGFSLSLLLVQTVVIIAVARLFGIVIHRFGQPRVIGEMIAGVALGPSLLGWAWPSAYHWMFSQDIISLNALSQVGIVLFIFLVGLELDLKEVRARFRQILVVSHAGMALPILGGGILALFLFHTYAPADRNFIEFALFFGCAMSVTAFPVLARILAELNLTATPLGITAIACASVADVTAWMMLAVVVAMERGAGNAGTTLWHTAVGAVVYLAVMFLILRPALARYWQRMVSQDYKLGYNGFSAVILVILCSALATELLNVHAIFGAFVAGVVMPRDERLQSAIRSRLEDILMVLLLPLFFAFTGLRTDVGLLATPRDWYFALWIILVAIAGKLGGTVFAACASAIDWRQAGALGVLMNSRGLMELVLLTIGLQDNIITPALFTMMVLMTIVTTMMAVPLLSWIMPSRGSVGAQRGGSSIVP